jgi:hypothetical protein
LGGGRALWSAHSQIQGAAAAKERDQKIIDLSEQLQGHLTGGDSFCYGYPFGSPDAPSFEWTFIHEGPYPLTDVFVRIYDLAKPPQKQVGGFGGPTLRFSSVFPGKMLTSDRLVDPEELRYRFQSG